MFNKVVKIFILFLLSTQVIAFAQTNQINADKSRILKLYNNYLRSIHLDQLMSATDFSFKDEFSQNSASGNLILSSVYVLTLRPNADFTNPIEFAATWDNMVSLLKNKTDIYSQLFFKLADYTDLQPPVLAISLNLGESGLFSFLIHFDGTLQVNKTSVDIKGEPVNPLNIDPGDLNNSMFGGYIQNVPFKQNLMKNVTEKVRVFLTNNKHQDKVDILLRNYGTGAVHFTAKNIKGQITKKFFEIVCITIVIYPASKRDMVDIAFYFTIGYASGGSTAPLNFQGYENVVRNYPGELSAYGARLKEIIQDTTNARNR